MHARAASVVLVGLGMLDVAALNLLLVPRLASISAAPATSIQRSESLAPEPPPRPVNAAEPGQVHEADGARPPAEVWAASVSRGAAAALSPAGRAAPDIAFSRDSARVERLTAFRDIRRVIQELADDPGRQVLLRGHSDPAGIPAYNLDLGRRRAEAVKRYLVQLGAPSDRIAVEAVGANEPLDPRPTPAAWARDRRVEVLWR